MMLTHPRHVINILPDMSLTGRDTPRPFQPPVAQSDVKAEVAHCVGGVMSPVMCNVSLAGSMAPHAALREHDSERLRGRVTPAITAHFGLRLRPELMAHRSVVGMGLNTKRLSNRHRAAGYTG